MAIVLPKLPRVRPSGRAPIGAAPSVEIELCRASAVYTAGEPMQVHWRLSHCQPAELERVELSVLWQTEGKGDEDLHVHHFQTWNSGQLQHAAMDEPQSIACTLPSSPLTYDGTLIRICWFVRVRVYHNDGRDFCSQLPIRVVGVYDDVDSNAAPG